jgi:hypothetical protein
MGVDLRYQGLPAGCGFIDLVRSRTWVDSSWISHVRGWLKWGVDVRGVRIMPGPGKKLPWPDEHEAQLLWAWCCDAVERFPDIGERNVDVHKSYQWLPFVLSAKVRKRLRWPKPDPNDPRSWDDPETEFDELADQAFSAAPQIAPGVTGTQGLPIHLMDRQVVNDLGLCVGAMESSDVAKRISELTELEVFANWDVPRCTVIFAEFREFFAEAATRGEDVLVIWD